MLFFGQIRPYKGLDELFLAWDEVTAAGVGSDTVPFSSLRAGATTMLKPQASVVR